MNSIYSPALKHQKQTSSKPLHSVNMKYLKEQRSVKALNTNNIFLKILVNLVILCTAFFVILLSISEDKLESRIILQRFDVFKTKAKSIDPNKPFFQKPPEVEGIDCSRFFQNDTEYENLYTENKLTYKGNILLSSNCSEIRMRSYFPEKPLSEAEAEFPIAFARIVYRVILNF